MTLKNDQAQLQTIDFTIGGFMTKNFRAGNPEVSKTKSKSPGNFWHLISTDTPRGHSSK